MRSVFLIIAFLVYGSSSNAQISANWKLTGPVKFPVNSSGQVNGLGRVSQVVFDPVDTSRLYAASASGGVYISSDGAKTWHVTPGTDKLPGMSCASLCVDYTNNNILYLGSGDANYYNNSFGIWKSTNGGTTWNPSNATIGNRLAVNILMDPTNHLTIIAATNDGIWKSTDGGVTWAEKQTGGDFREMKFNTGNANTLYAVTSTSFYRSTDMGETWTLITLPASNTSGGRIGVSNADANRVYVTFVGNYSGNLSTPVYKSTDGGLTFTTVKPANTYNLNGYTETQSGQGNYNYTMTVDPLNANNVWICGHCVFKSTDGGTTWSRQTSWAIQMHTDMHQVVYSPHNASKLFNANDGGVWTNTDGGTGITWVPVCDGLDCTEYYHAAQSPIKKDRVSAGAQDNGELYYNATTWYTNRGGDWGQQIAFDYLNTDWVYYPNDNNTTGASRRIGMTGSSQTLGIPFPVTWSTPICFETTPLQTNTAFAASADVWISTNLTSNPPTWTQVTSVNETFKALCISPADANVVYGVTVSGKVFRCDNGLSTSPTFAQVSTSPTAPSSKASIAVMKAAPSVVYMSCNSQVYRSADKGVTWTNVTSGLPSTNFIKMCHDIYSTNESIYIANGVGAVYYKNSTLSSWTNYSQGLPTIASARDFMIYNDGDYANSILRLGYFGRGVWETLLVSPTPGPLPAFLSTSATICPGSSVTFHDTSIYNPTSWSWSFTGGSPSSSTVRNPTVTYAAAGTYSVTLTVSNSAGSNSITKNSYVKVSNSTPISLPVTVVSQSSFSSGETASNVFDNDTTTFWQDDWAHSATLPYTLVYDLGSPVDLGGLDFLNRQDNSNGYPKNVELSTSSDNITWSAPTTVTFTNTNSWQTAVFSGANSRYFQVKVTSTISGSNVCSIAEIRLQGCPTAIATGIASQPGEQKGLSVYPNPNSGSFDVNIRFSKEENGVLLITDVLGRTVYQDQIHGEAYSKTMNLQEKGMYLITVITGNNRLTRRVIVE
ncbi:MAG TPA: discoidin domain-containing protein [Bacteroidia bacterium]|nr:discoidin domain-containing protein [Bacteroidia bacterium]